MTFTGLTASMCPLGGLGTAVLKLPVNLIGISKEVLDICVERLIVVFKG